MKWLLEVFRSWNKQCELHRDNFLVLRHLKEATALAQQLHRIVAAQPESEHQSKVFDRRKGGQKAAYSHQQLPTQPPPPSVAKRLQRALTAGWADQVPASCITDCYSCLERLGCVL